MGPEIIVAIIGPLAATVFGTAAYFQKRQINYFDDRMSVVAEQLEEVYDHVTSLRIALPERYVTKDEFVNHVRTEEHWQEQVINELRQVKEEVIVLRVTSHSNASGRPNN